MIDREELIEDIRAYADLKCANGEIEIANGILKSLSIIKEQSEVNKWTEPRNKLPGQFKDCFLVTIKRLDDGYKWAQILLWDVYEWKWWEEDDKEVDASRFKILAWQSLPESYKGENYD